VTTLLVATTGGHLNELVRLAPRLVPSDEDVIWVTHDTLQSRSLLTGARVVFVPEVGSRDVRATAVNAVLAWRVLRRSRPDRVVSTGSAIAVAFLPVARALGITSHYIESGTRVLGPSVTGRVLERIGGVHCYTQHEHWTSARWAHAGSILDGYEQAVLSPRPPVRRVVVALGTWEQSFRRLVEQLVPLVPRDADVLWQTGHTDVTGLVPQPRPWVSPETMLRAMAEADVVVTHAGMGATLDALDAGRCPIVVPRRPENGEQLDDHQVQLAAELDRRSLAVVRDVGDLTAADLRDAAGLQTRRRDPLPPFHLDEGRVGTARRRPTAQRCLRKASR